MKINEKRLFESYKDLELLLKTKFNDDFDGVTEYIERMQLHEAEGAPLYLEWNDTLKSLVTLRAKRNNIAHGNRASGTVPEDIDCILNFEESVKRDEDPLQKYYIHKGYIKITKTPEHDDEQYVEFDDLEYSTLKSQKSLYKIAPIVIVAVILIVLALWAYQRMNASLL